MRRVGVYGWGIVAPQSPDIDTFARNLQSSESWLSPFEGFGPSNFLAGNLDFDFEAYRGWIEARFPPNRFSQLTSKMDPTALYAIGSFIQALGQNPGIEEVLQELGPLAHVYLGTGLGAYPTMHAASIQLDRAQQRWNRFWADPERCEPLRAHLSGVSRGTGPGRTDLSGAPSSEAAGSDTLEGADVPPNPSGIADRDDRDDAERVWNAWWAERSASLREYLADLAEIERIAVTGEVEAGKLQVIREKERRRTRLRDKWGAPDPPWSRVNTNVLWNLPSTPASQVSMLGRITGMAYAPVAACATFGVCLKLALDAIRTGEARAVVIGAADPPPHALTVGAFQGARVVSADGEVSKPLTGLRGTHVSGGAVVWIVGDREFMESKGFHPLGMEPLSVGVSSDAGHIITPSREGPLAAIRSALERGGVAAEELTSWDLHATATPGDFLEVANMREIAPPNVLVTARKGTFGHGMSGGGGWELTAQYLGVQEGVLLPTPLHREELNPQIAEVHDAFVYDTACPAPMGPMGKMSMGVGGVNACVISRPIE